MGVNWVLGGRIQPIDLELLADRSSYGYCAIEVMTEMGTRYSIDARNDTLVDEDYIHNVRFRSEYAYKEFSDELDALILAPFVAVSSLSNWVKERRHFPKDDVVSLPVAELEKGMPLIFGDKVSSPLIRGYVFGRDKTFPYGLPLF